MLALIAGRGALPAAVAGAQGRRPLVCALEGYAPDGLLVDITFRVETIGSLMARLREMGVTDVCFCGSIDRPKVDPTCIDALTAPLVPTIAAALQAGEDGALRALIGLFEATGMVAHAANNLAPNLVLPPSQPTRAQVPTWAARDVDVALQVLAAQGAADMGQACVIRAGSVLAREDTRGTDAMLLRLSARAAPLLDDGDIVSDLMDSVGLALGGAADWLSGDGGRSGVLFKAPKPEQDVRVDLPTIGPATAQGAKEANLAGIVIAAHGVIVLDQPRVLTILDGAGMFLWVR